MSHGRPSPSFARLAAAIPLVVALVAAVLLGGGAAPARAATGTLLRDGTGLYPRAIRLEHSGSANGRVLASVVTFSAANDGQGAIYESTDGGGSFQQVGTVADPGAAAGKGLCCATLYELPQAVGSMPAGTLLWAASVGQSTSPRQMTIRLFKSTDTGRSWSYLSTAATAPNASGLWEPELSVDASGQLVVHYSDETDGVHSQKLVAVRSSDGVTWTGKHDTVAGTAAGDRPGMAIVRKLPNGTYVMAYEGCGVGGQYDCAVHLRTSADGWNWGDPADLGTMPRTADGTYFRHTPNLGWAPLAGSPDGQLLLVGQELDNADGTVAAASRREIWSNAAGGTGTWNAAAAPVAVASAAGDYCPNYSSALLPSADSSTVLEIATDYDGSVCKPYYATGSTR